MTEQIQGARRSERAKIKDEAKAIMANTVKENAAIFERYTYTDMDDMIELLTEAIDKLRTMARRD